MNPETILALVQLGRFAMDAIDSYSKGEMTEDEIAAEFAKLKTRLAQANAMWERAGE